jgi:hypothetical protein
MPALSALGSALPPTLAAYVERAVAEGGAPLPLVELNTRVPTTGPITFGGDAAFSVTLYPGPMMHFAVTPRLGTRLNTTA